VEEQKKEQPAPVIIEGEDIKQVMNKREE